MAGTVKHQHGASAATPRETDLHFLAREARTGLRWLVLVSAVATVLTMVLAWFIALIPALCLLTFYILLVIANEIERRSSGPHEEDEERAPTARELAEAAPAAAELERKRELDEAFDARTMRIIIEIVAGLSVIALIIAGILFGWELLAIGAVVLLAYMLFIAAPVWLGWIEDDTQEETHHAETAGTKSS